MKTMLQSIKALVLILSLLSATITFAHPDKSFFNDPPTAVCNNGQAQVDQNHDLPYTGRGSTFNWNDEGLAYPAQTITVGLTGLLGRVDTEFTPANTTFGGTVTLTIVEGPTPKHPQTVLATQTVIPTQLNVAIILDNPIPVTAGQQLTLIFTGTLSTSGGIVSEPAYADTYGGGDRWGTNDGGNTWYGPYDNDFDFITYVMAGPTINIDESGIAIVDPGLINGGSYDETTDPANLIYHVSPTHFDCSDLGTQAVTLTVTDEGGLTSSCVANIAVKDENSLCCSEPLASCKYITVVLNYGEAHITPEDIDDGSVAPCGLAMLEIDKDYFDCLDFGENVVTLRVTDSNGNTNECSSLVTVEGVPCDWYATPDGINCPGGNNASYNINSSTFTLINEGCYNPDYYRATDAQGYTWTSFCNDGYFMAEVNDVDGPGWGGIAMREGSGPSDKMVQIMIDRFNLTRREFRQTSGGTAFAHQFQTQGRHWLKIERTGSLFKSYSSMDGNNWELVSMANISMPPCIEAGLITMNGAPNSLTAANFHNVMKFEVGALSAPPTTLDIQAEADFTNSFSVFPNPTNGLTTIEIPPSLPEENLDIQVFNPLGQLIIQKDKQHANIGHLTIDLSPYQNGIYLIRINANDKRLHKKIVLEKF